MQVVMRLANVMKSKISKQPQGWNFICKCKDICSSVFTEKNALDDEDRVNRKFGGCPAAVMSAVKVSTKPLGNRWNKERRTYIDLMSMLYIYLFGILLEYAS